MEEFVAEVEAGGPMTTLVMLLRCERSMPSQPHVFPRVMRRFRHKWRARSEISRSEACANPSIGTATCAQPRRFDCANRRRQRRLSSRRTRVPSGAIAPCSSCFLCVCDARVATFAHVAFSSRVLQALGVFCLQKTAPPADLTQSGPGRTRKRTSPTRRQR